jgi:UDP-glucose 4-epimerase
VKVLVAGGAGYIGSTVASRLSDLGHRPVILDNLVTGRAEFAQGHPFYEGDIADSPLVDRIFSDHPDVGAVVHAAALIVVPESVADPLRYYVENVAKSIEFCRSLVRNGCQRLLFSSSASIYGPADDFTVDEQSPLAPQSPYARTKAVLETVLGDVAAGTRLRVVSLRYFNPIGSDPQLRTGLQVAEPSHALGKMLQAHSDGTPFQVTGADWPTRDGTGIRDYIHVWDLARAHAAALERFDEVIERAGTDGSLVINLGTGTGTTVRELLNALRSVVGDEIRSVDVPRRPGDVAGCFTRSTRARDLLGWQPELSIEAGIRDTLRWFEVRGDRLAGFAESAAIHDGGPS